METPIQEYKKFDFRFFYPLINLKKKLTPYQMKIFQMIHEEGGRIETWKSGGILRTIKLMQSKGMPLVIKHIRKDWCSITLYYPLSLLQSSHE